MNISLYSNASANVAANAIASNNVALNASYNTVAIDYYRSQPYPQPPIQYIVYRPIYCITSFFVKHMIYYERVCFVNVLRLTTKTSKTNVTKLSNCLL